MWGCVSSRLSGGGWCGWPLCVVSGWVLGCLWFHGACMHVCVVIWCECCISGFCTRATGWWFGLMVVNSEDFGCIVFSCIGRSCLFLQVAFWACGTHVAVFRVSCAISHVQSMMAWAFGGVFGRSEVALVAILCVISRTASTDVVAVTSSLERNKICLNLLWRVNWGTSHTQVWILKGSL